MSKTFFRCASISWFQVVSEWLIFFGFPVNQVIPVIPVSQVIPVIPVSQVISVTPISQVIPVIPVSQVTPVISVSQVIPVIPVSQVITVIPVSQVIDSCHREYSWLLGQWLDKPRLVSTIWSSAVAKYTRLANENHHTQHRLVQCQNLQVSHSFLSCHCQMLNLI